MYCKKNRFRQSDNQQNRTVRIRQLLVTEVAVDSVRGEMTIKHLLPIDETVPLHSRGHGAEEHAPSEVMGGRRASSSCQALRFLLRLRPTDRR